MPGAIRPNEKNAKIVYKIKRTPKEMQQNNPKDKTYINRKRIEGWARDSIEGNS